MSDITPADLRARQQAGTAPRILDVRETWEHEETRIPGAENIPLATLPEHLESLSADKDAELVVQCKSGTRSAAAQAFLRQHGFTNVRNLVGGILAWGGQ